MRIVISGTTGIGKSTIINSLYKKITYMGRNAKFIPDKTFSSVYLNYFFENPKEWGYLSQIDILCERFKQILTYEQNRIQYNDNQIYLYERYIFDDYAYAKVHFKNETIDEEQWNLYKATFKRLTNKLIDFSGKPELLIILKGDEKVVLDRFSWSSNKYKDNAPENYWKNLYDEFYLRSSWNRIVNNNSIKVIEVDTTNKEPNTIVDEIIIEAGI